MAILLPVPPHVSYKWPESGTIATYYLDYVGGFAWYQSKQGLVLALIAEAGEGERLTLGCRVPLYRSK